MKKQFLLIASLVLAITGFSQKSDIKRPTLGVNFMLNDFRTAYRIENTNLGSVLSNKQVSKIKDMDAGLSLTYLQGITTHLDFMGTLGGSFTNYPKNGISGSDENFLLSTDAALNLKLLKDKYFVTPYVTAGISGSLFKKTFASYSPVGLGFQFNLGQEDAFLFLQGVYKIGVSKSASDYLSYQLGFAAPLTEKKAQLPPIVTPPVVEVDTDGDGIVDSKDKCPDVAGVVKYEGCPIPDTDKDGINDDEDKCPTIAGLPKYQGCPIPDTDGDKINDEEDKCPNVAGLARYNGCPIPDRDNDGINDEEDKCPDEAGLAANNGCPKPVIPVQEIEEKLSVAAKNIYFKTASAVLLSKSYAALNDVYTIMEAYPTVNLSIEGHTDNVGKDAYNLTLSKKRAASVLNYLVKKGVSKIRIKSQGYGESKPKATNKTAAGRAQNRRVEMHIEEAE